MVIWGYFAYNTDLVSEEDAPRTWDDLLDPRWNGQIVMTDPGSSGSIKYFVGALMNSPAYGTAYFERLRENGCMLWRWCSVRIACPSLERM